MPAGIATAAVLTDIAHGVMGMHVLLCAPTHLFRQWSHKINLRGSGVFSLTDLRMVDLGAPPASCEAKTSAFDKRCQGAYYGGLGEGPFLFSAESLHTSIWLSSQFTYMSHKPLQYNYNFRVISALRNSRRYRTSEPRPEAELIAGNKGRCTCVP
jgi:hypothetical protein